MGKFLCWGKDKTLVEQMEFNDAGFLIRHDQFDNRKDHQKRVYTTTYSYSDDNLRILAKTTEGTEQLRVQYEFYSVFNKDHLPDSLIQNEFINGKYASGVTRKYYYDLQNRLTEVKKSFDPSSIIQERKLTYSNVYERILAFSGFSLENMLKDRLVFPNAYSKEGQGLYDTSTSVINRILKDLQRQHSELKVHIHGSCDSVEKVYFFNFDDQYMHLSALIEHHGCKVCIKYANGRTISFQKEFYFSTLVGNQTYAKLYLEYKDKIFFYQLLDGKLDHYWYVTRQNGLITDAVLYDSHQKKPVCTLQYVYTWQL